MGNSVPIVGPYVRSLLILLFLIVSLNPEECTVAAGGSTGHSRAQQSTKAHLLLGASNAKASSDKAFLK